MVEVFLDLTEDDGGPGTRAQFETDGQLEIEPVLGRQEEALAGQELNAEGARRPAEHPRTGRSPSTRPQRYKPEGNVRTQELQARGAGQQALGTPIEAPELSPPIDKEGPAETGRSSSPRARTSARHLHHSDRKELQPLNLTRLGDPQKATISEIHQRPRTGVQADQGGGEGCSPGGLQIRNDDLGRGFDPARHQERARGQPQDRGFASRLRKLQPTALGPTGP